jgi:hypothetical protein
LVLGCWFGLGQQELREEPTTGLATFGFKIAPFGWRFLLSFFRPIHCARKRGWGVGGSDGALTAWNCSQGRFSRFSKTEEVGERAQRGKLPETKFACFRQGEFSGQAKSWLVPIAGIAIRVGKRRIKIPKQLVGDFEKLTKAERKALAQAASGAKTDSEAVAIIARGLSKNPAHHIATKEAMTTGSKSNALLTQ